ncbi:hypothetical protein D9M71_242180 [compost metagenome]
MLRNRQQATGHGANRRGSAGVGMQHTQGVMARTMDGSVDYISSRVEAERLRWLINDVTVQMDLVQA